ncbi:hypothetical protein KAR91_64845 [Candidatus Pacearchaeota archaeon]|nr:hypothetical protein [Candidatus Pacearchaeota archaeon]
MSDYHIRTISEDLKTGMAVFHFPIPNSTNLVGTNWRDVMVSNQGGPDKITSLMYDIEASELVELKNGAKVEKYRMIRFSSLDLTNLQRLGELEAAYTLDLAGFQAEMEKVFNFFGKSGDV